MLPDDGEAVGEFEVRGPWITGSYYGDPAPTGSTTAGCATGDVGTLDRRGFMQITDRTKDVIKSGGEWISSVELENEVMAHPERPRGGGHRRPRRQVERAAAGGGGARRRGRRCDADDLVAFLSGRVSRWWLPERWAFVEEVPKTSVGKFDKKVDAVPSTPTGPRGPRGRAAAGVA